MAWQYSVKVSLMLLLIVLINVRLGAYTMLRPTGGSLQSSRQYRVCKDCTLQATEDQHYVLSDCPSTVTASLGPNTFPYSNTSYHDAP